jgi:hypothetical protein
LKQEKYWTRPYIGNFDITKSAIYRKSTYPYSPKLVISLDQRGLPLSYFDDDVWDFTALKDCIKVTWSGGKNRKLSEENLRLCKSIILAVIYDKRILRGRLQSLRALKTLLMKYSIICDNATKPNGKSLLISELSSYPKLIPQLTECFRSDWTKEFSVLEKLYRYREEVGFVLLSESSLQKIAHILVKKPLHLEKQHPVIPPRIWHYQISRIESLLNDFNSIKASLFKIIDDVKSASAQNKRLFFQNQKAIGVSTTLSIPYLNPLNNSKTFEGKLVFSRSFHQMLRESGVLIVLNRYNDPSKIYTLQSITTILEGVRDSAFAYIQFFSLQRISETISLHVDCLSVEKDERLGDVYILSGETTKTIQDDDAKWLVPKRVELGLNIAKDISTFIYKYLPENLVKDSNKRPLRVTSSHLGFNPNPPKQLVSKGSVMYKLFDGFFQKEHMTITLDDYNFAKALTPDIVNREDYQIGQCWKWQSHQCRRTMIVYMLSSGLISIQSVQYLAKHMHSFMTQYYGRNYTNITLNESVANDIILESYLSKARKVQQVHDQQNQVVFPHKTNKLLNAVSGKSEKELIAKFKSEELGFRPTLLGFCAKAGYCPYGGVESITKCAGSNGGSICAEAIFAIDNQESLLNLKTSYKKEYDSLASTSMRRKAIGFEIKAIEIYEAKINE